MVTTTSYGDNAQIPSANSSVYLPDQLIAGNEHLVTDNATINGSVALKRGTVMGLSSFGSLTSSTGTAYGSGSVIVAAVPTDGDTLTIGGTVITFKAQPTPYTLPPAGVVYIGATTALTAQALLSYLQNSTDANLVKFTYSLSGSTITTTAAAIGTGGNALTLATSNGTSFTVSGATLSGGVANTGNATLSLMSAGATLEPGKYVATCLTATTAAVTDPSGDNLGTATFGTTFVNPEISFRITAGGTPCVAGDQFVIVATPQAAGLYKQCVGTATDGSEVPIAILADDADPSSGNVKGGIYLKGEFNVNAIILDPTLSVQAVKAQLAARSIYLKNVVSAGDPS